MSTSGEEAARDAYWRMYKEHCDHLRHHEVQRSTVASSMIGICGVLLSVATFDKAITAVDVPLFLMIIALGVFGGLFTTKQWERSALHMERARAYRDAVDGTLVGNPIKQLKRLADQKQKANFQRLSKLRINKFWMVLYVFVCVTGVTLTALAIWWPIEPAP